MIAKDHEAAWAALNAADVYAAHVVTEGEATLADAIAHLAAKRDEYVRATITAEGDLRVANIANAELLREVGGLRAEAATLRAQLAYASERIESAMRAPREGEDR